MTIDEIKKIAESTTHTVGSVASSMMSRAERGLPLNLQFFADPEDPPADPVDPPKDPEDPPADPPKDPKPADPPEATFTQEQVDQMIRDRVARAEKDKEKAIKEAEKLAKMNADEKQKYKYEKLEEENERLKAEQNKYALGREASKMLAETGIAADDEILDFVVKEDAETTNTAVKAFSDLIEKISDEKMKEKLKGKPPKKNAQQDGFKNPFSKEHFNLTEQGRLLKDDPELYKQLKAQAK